MPWLIYPSQSLDRKYDRYTFSVCSPLQITFESLLFFFVALQRVVFVAQLFLKLTRPEFRAYASHLTPFAYLIIINGYHKNDALLA